MNETRIYGTMVVLAGKDGCAKDLVNVFIPTFDEKIGHWKEDDQDDN